MKFFSPMNLWFLILIPMFIAMYILKRKHEEVNVSSTMLWKEALENLEASTPWEKLKTNVLFFLQLLTLLLLIFSLATPFIYSNLKGYSNVIIAFDNSGSMNYKTKSGTKLEDSKKEAIDIVNNLPSSAEVTIIKSSPKAEIILSSSKDKKAARNIINEITSSNAIDANDGAISLIKSMASVNKDIAYYYFTDEEIKIDNVKGQVVSFEKVGENALVENLATVVENNEINALATISNNSKEPKNLEVSLYGDDKLLQIKEISIGGEESLNVQFDKVTNNIETMYVEIDIDDSLNEDNRYYSVVNQTTRKKILMISERNLFLEKAISLRNDVEFFKTNDANEIKEGYDVYIYDGIMPEELPKEGNVLIINPSLENKYVSLDNEVEGGKALFVKSKVTEYIEGEGFELAKFKPINLNGNFESFIELNDKSLGAVGVVNNSKIAVLSFDIHDSDMPLTYNFPVLMNNLVNYLCGNNIIDRSDFICSEEVKISILSDVKNLKIINNNKDEKTFNTDNEKELIYKDTINPGIYEAIQNSKEINYDNKFSVNFPREESKESNFKNNESVEKSNDNTSVKGINITNLLIILAIILVVLEWFFYIKLNNK